MNHELTKRERVAEKRQVLTQESSFVIGCRGEVKDPVIKLVAELEGQVNKNDGKKAPKIHTHRT